MLLSFSPLNVLLFWNGAPLLKMLNVNVIDSVYIYSKCILLVIDLGSVLTQPGFLGGAGGRRRLLQ
jgi:hypothetical protein